MRRTAEDDDDDDDPYDPGFDSDGDEPYDSDSDSEDDTTTACQSCGAAVYDDAERCPSCGNYLSEEEAPSRFPLWVKITAVICLGVAVMWAIHGC